MFFRPVQYERDEGNKRKVENASEVASIVIIIKRLCEGGGSVEVVRTPTRGQWHNILQLVRIS